MSSYIFRTISVLVAACAAMVLVGSSVCYAFEINVKCSQCDIKNTKWNTIPGEPGVTHTVLTKGMREDDRAELIIDWDDVPEDAPDSRYTTVHVVATCGQPSSDSKAWQRMWPVGSKLTCGPNVPIFINVLSPSGTDCPLVAGEPKYSYVADLLKEGSKAAPVAPVKTRAEYLAEAEKLKEQIEANKANIAAAEQRIQSNVNFLADRMRQSLGGGIAPQNATANHQQNNGMILQLRPQIQQQPGLQVMPTVAPTAMGSMLYPFK